MAHYFTNNENLKSDFRTIIYKYQNFNLEFTSDLGVFSKDKVDFGSRLLMETYFKNGKKDITALDVGCGYGIIGLCLAKIMNTKSTLIDVNKRAVHLSKINSKKLHVEADVYESDVYSNVENNFDLIITNPPIRAGKSVVLNILIGAKEHLNKDGELWCVIRKEQGAKSIIEKLKEYYNVNIIEKSKGFYIIVAKCC